MPTPDSTSHKPLPRLRPDLRIEASWRAGPPAREDVVTAVQLIVRNCVYKMGSLLACR